MQQNDHPLHLSPNGKDLYRRIEESTGSLAHWPTELTRLFVGRHLDNNGRFKLTAFLLANGVPPTLIVEWYLERRVLRDKSAHDNVATVIRHHKTGKLEEKGYLVHHLNVTSDKPVALRKHAWDGVGEPARDHLRTIQTPNFAHDFQHEYYWDDAVAMLVHAAAK